MGDSTGKTITLSAGETYVVSARLAPYFNGILQGESSDNKASVQITGSHSLFSQVSEEGNVKNIAIEIDGTVTSSSVNSAIGALTGLNYGNVENCDIESGTIGSADSPINNTGSLVGYNYGTIQDCSVGAGVTVNGASWVGGITGINQTTGEITNCESAATVIGSGSYIGGIVGQNHNTVQECVYSGDVSGNSADVGGVVGQNFKNVIDCSSSGNVTSTGTSVGGVVGDNAADGYILACYSTSKVEGVGNAGVGGVVGSNLGSLTACYSTGNVTGRTSSCRAGGVVGWSIGGSVRACYHADGIVTGADSGMFVFTGGVVGYINRGSFTACYWSGSPGQGIGQDDTNQGDQALEVNGTSVDWANAVTQMNIALSGTSWQYELTGTLPTLTQN